MMMDLNTLIRQFNSCKPEMKKLFRLSDISNTMPIALATDYLSQSIQLTLSMRSMLQAIADHPTEATPEQISGMKTIDDYLSKNHDDYQVKLIQRYIAGYDTICNNLKNIDWGPWNAPTHFKTLDKLEDCLGDLAITLEAVKQSCSDHLTDDDVRQQEQNLSALINKRQVIYNLVEESVAYWSKRSACNHICNKCWKKGGNSAACSEPTENTDEVFADTDDEKVTCVENPRTEVVDSSPIVSETVMKNPSPILLELSHGAMASYQ